MGRIRWIGEWKFVVDNEKTKPKEYEERTEKEEERKRKKKRGGERMVAVQNVNVFPADLRLNRHRVFFSRITWRLVQLTRHAQCSTTADIVCRNLERNIMRKYTSDRFKMWFAYAHWTDWMEWIFTKAFPSNSQLPPSNHNQGVRYNRILASLTPFSKNHHEWHLKFEWRHDNSIMFPFQLEIYWWIVTIRPSDAYLPLIHLLLLK